jgi:predicted permease
VLSSVLLPLVPVILCIGLGFVTARVGWVRASAIPDLSNLVFLVLTPALLFRTMGQVRLQELDFQPVALYFGAVALLFALTLAFTRFSTRAAARALAHTFGNLVMIGVPLVGLVYGPQGLVTLFTLVSLHSLVLLTAATLVFELAEARELQRSGQAEPRPMTHTVCWTSPCRWSAPRWGPWRCCWWASPWRTRASARTGATRCASPP